MLKKLGLISIITASAMAMHTAEININDVDLELGATFDVGQFNTNVAPNTMFVGIKYLNADEDNSDLDDPNGYFEANFLVQKEINNSGFYAGLGLKLNYIDTNSDLDFISLPLSFRGGYELKEAIVPFYFMAQIDYAPKVLSMQDAKNYFAFRVEAEAAVVENASVYVGYRNLQVEYDVINSSLESYDKAFYLGFKFKF